MSNEHLSLGTEELILVVVGNEWPTGNPDQLRAMADDFRQMAGFLTNALAEAQGLTQLAQEGLQGSTGDSFAIFGQSLTDSHGVIPEIIQACNEMADALDAQAAIIETVRIDIYECLATLMIELTFDIAVSWLTWGLSEAEMALQIAQTRVTVLRIIRRAIYDMASHEAEIVDGSIKSLTDIGRYVKALTPWRETVPSIKDFASDIGSDLLHLTPSLLYHEVKQTAQQAFFDFNAQAYEHDKWGRPYNGSEVIDAAENGAVGGAFDHAGGLVIGYAGKVLDKPIESLANSSSQILKKSVQDLKKFSSNTLGLNKFATNWKSNSKWKLRNPNGSLTTNGKVLSRTNKVAIGAGKFAAKGARESILNVPVGAGAAAVQDKVVDGSVTQPNQSEGVISDPESGVLNAIGNGYFGVARKSMNPGNEVLDASILKIQNALKNLAIFKSGKFGFVQQINLVDGSVPGTSTSTGTASSTTPVSGEPRTTAPAIAGISQHQPSDTTPAHPDPADVALPASRPPTPHPADVPLPPSRPASAPPDLGRNLHDTAITSPRAPDSGGIPAAGPDAPAHAGPALQDSGPPSLAAVGNASPGPQGAAGPGQQSSVLSASPSGDDTAPETTEPGAWTSSPAPGAALPPSESAAPPPRLATPPPGTATEDNSEPADQQTGPDGKPKKPSVLTQPLITVLKKPTAPGPGPDGKAWGE